MIKFLKSLLILLALQFSFSIQAQVWKKQAKSGNAGLLDIVFISKSTGFVLSSGKVLRTSDTGKTWTQILSSYSRFTLISFIDPSNGYIIGYDDLVLKTSDGGANWSLKRTGNSDDDLLNFFAIDQDTIFITGPDNLDNLDSVNYLEYSYNGGNSWSRRSLNSSKIITSLKMWTKNKGIISTVSNGVFETNNGFSSYTINTSPNIQISDFKVIQDSIIVMIGNSGKLTRSINYGKTYKNVTSPTSENLKGLHFANDSVGMACGAKGTILFTHNRGLSWSLMDTHTKMDFTKVFVINPYLAWAVTYSINGDSLDIFKYEDKSCISRFVKVPRDTVICDKYTYVTPFIIKGLNKPTWSVDDNLTQLYRKNDTTASIVGTHEGRFEIAFELQNCEEILRDTFIVYIWRNPNIYVKDSLYCGSVIDNISFSCFGCQYLWSDNSNAYNFLVNQPGKYWVRVTNRCKTISDTFKLSYLPFLKLDLGHDTIVCNKEKLVLKNTLSPGKYLWNDKDTNAIKTISKEGKYYLNFKNKCNDLIDTINVKYKRTPTIDLGRDSLYCNIINHNVSLDSVKNYSTVKWDDGNLNYSRNLTLPGKYEVIVSNECGSAQDSIHLNVTKKPTADLGKDTTYCKNFKHTIGLKPGVSIYTAEWWDKDDSPMREFTTEGTYSVRIYNQCGESRDTIIIYQKSIPVVNLGKDTSLKKPFSIILDAKNAGNNFVWNTGSISQTVPVSDYGKYWVTVSNYCGLAADTIVIKDKAGLKNILKNSIKIYPNPVMDGKLIIENLAGEYEIELFDQLGKKVSEIVILNKKQIIDISQLNQGIYYLKITSNGIINENIRLQKL